MNEQLPSQEQIQTLLSNYELVLACLETAPVASKNWQIQHQAMGFVSSIIDSLNADLNSEGASE